MEQERRRPLPRGQQLLELPQFNKGTAFTLEERLKHGLLGLLPPHEETLEQQMARAYRAFQAKNSDIERHIYLRQLQDNNETLFYRLIMDYPAEMTPIIYTPTVGEACQRFSEIYRKPRGLFIAYPEREHIDQILDNAIPETVEVIVMTDSEAILGIGDQGAGAWASRSASSRSTPPTAASIPRSACRSCSTWARTTRPCSTTRSISAGRIPGSPAMTITASSMT